jgi:hypothetical protein
VTSRPPSILSIPARASTMPISRFASALAIAVSIRLSAQPVPTVKLNPANATLREEFSNLSISAVRELRDGRVLVVETGSVSRLVVADFVTNTVTSIGRKGSGPGEFDVAASIFALAGDSTLMLGGMSRWLVLDGARIVATTKPDDPGLLAARAMILGVDHRGAVLSFVPGASSGDSSAIGLVSRRTGTITPIVKLAVGVEPGYPPRDRKGERINGTRGAWVAAGEMSCLFPDGWVAVARLNPYRVDWRSPDGTWTRGSALPVPVVRIDEREKRAYMTRVAKRSGDPVQPASAYPSWPTTVPPFDRFPPPLAAPDGKVLIARTPTADHPEMRYDIIDRAGRLERQLVLGANERILGFGARSVYVAVTDDDGVQRIERHPWP